MSFSLAPHAKAKDIDKNFSYEIHVADIFSKPTNSGFDKSMAAALKKLLKKARNHVHLAIYGIRNQPWLEMLLHDLRKKKIDVQAVVDQQNGTYGEWVPQNFMYRDTPKLPAILGPSKVMPDMRPDGSIRKHSIMHNKFMVVDSRYLWTGSTNFSDTGIGTEVNANVSITIDSRELAQEFDKEFNQMFKERRFSVAKEHINNETLNYKDGTRVRFYFSPQDTPVDEAVLPFIQKAQRQLNVGIFFLTEIRIIKALAAAVKRGVKVRIIYDTMAANHPYSNIALLKKGGVDVRVENWSGKMHMKAAVADGRNILLGSMNWSIHGNNLNDENTLVVENNRTFARDLNRYFEHLWDSLDDTGQTSFGVGFLRRSF